MLFPKRPLRQPANMGNHVLSESVCSLGGYGVVRGPLSPRRKWIIGFLSGRMEATRERSNPLESSGTIELVFLNTQLANEDKCDWSNVHEVPQEA
jgi:hypothetical protein